MNGSGSFDRPRRLLFGFLEDPRRDDDDEEEEGEPGVAHGSRRVSSAILSGCREKNLPDNPGDTLLPVKESTMRANAATTEGVAADTGAGIVRKRDDESRSFNEGHDL